MKFFNYLGVFIGLSFFLVYLIAELSDYFNFFSEYTGDFIIGLLLGPILALIITVYLGAQGSKPDVYETGEALLDSAKKKFRRENIK